jgi:hypothetical protein
MVNIMGKILWKKYHEKNIMGELRFGQPPELLALLATTTTTTLATNVQRPLLNLGCMD